MSVKEPPVEPPHARIHYMPRCHYCGYRVHDTDWRVEHPEHGWVHSLCNEERSDEV